jgi:hypothetical protein
MNIDSIAVVAFGVNTDSHGRQIRHVTNLLQREGFRVVPYGTEAWEDVICSVADNIVRDPALPISMDLFEGEPQLPEDDDTPSQEDPA